MHLCRCVAILSGSISIVLNRFLLYVLQCIDSHTTRLYVNKFAHALRKVGLRIDIQDLKKLVRPYMEESKDKSE